MTLDLFNWKPNAGSRVEDKPDRAHAVGGGHARQSEETRPAAGNVADPQLGPEGTSAPSTRARTPASIEDRFAEFHRLNPHIAKEMLRLAQRRLDRGETFISVKALWEELRVSLIAIEEGGCGPAERTDGKIAASPYKLNNSFTALYARKIIAMDPRLERVIEVRKRKTE